jgi:hypothetical protein
VHCDFPPKCRFWPHTSSFSLCNIRIEFFVGSGYSGDTNAFIDHLQLCTNTVFGFVNSRGLVIGLQGIIEGKIDTVNGLLVDVLAVTGATDRTLKVTMINMCVGHVAIPADENRSGPHWARERLVRARITTKDRRFNAGDGGRDRSD